MSRVLFIGHEATYSGAPIALLHLLRWFRAHSTLESELLLLKGGPLVPAFRSLVPTTVFPREPEEALYSPARELIMRLFQEHLHRLPPDLVYLNTVVAGQTLSKLHFPSSRVVLHVHEMASVFRYSRTWDIAMMCSRVDRFIAVSHAVRRLLEGTFGIDPSAIRLIHEGVPDAAQAVQPEAKVRARREMGISPDAVVVGMAGTVCRRKGTDLFIDMARRLIRCGRIPSCHFLWVGEGGEYEAFRAHWQRQFAVSSVEASRFHFIGERSDVLPFIAAMDVFTLTSREDPFPLAHLEAALLEKPILCFRDAGGAEEWVEAASAGYCLPFGDVQAMADAVERLSTKPTLRARLGAGAREYTCRHFLIDTIAPQVREVIETMRAD